MSTNSEQHLNLILSSVLRSKHPCWKNDLSSEKTGILAESAGLRPDIVVVHPNGLPVIIETEIEPARTVELDARSRLGKTLKDAGYKIEQSISVCYPRYFATISQNDLNEAILSAKFKFCVHYDKGNVYKNSRWPEKGWIIGDIDELAACIEHTGLSESKMAYGMEILEKGISESAYHLRRNGKVANDMLEKIAKKLNQRDGIQTSRMALAILANAFVFHASIAGTHQIKSFEELKNSYGTLLKSSILDEWRHILNNVNYWPVFKIAIEIFSPIRDDVSNTIINKLTEVTYQLISIGATSQHDLSGRMFQRLITDRKFLATYYTLPSSAALLAELAVSRIKRDWGSAKDVTSLRIADFACGTGALLNAAYSAISSRYRRRGGDDSEIHAKILENTLVGCDIMPAATHLTASIISSAHPALPFKSTQIITLPYGVRSDVSGHPISIGALDLIEDVEVFPIFKTGMDRIRGDKEKNKENISLPHKSFDLVIMNPPFTRPTNSEAESAGVPIPSFAGFSTEIEERHQMSKKLKNMKRPDMAGHGNAGLASNFIDLAKIKVKKGGVVALILPATFVSGDSWLSARKLFELLFTNILIVSIANSKSGKTSFSADTSIGEVLVVATRKREESNNKSEVTYINLKNRPESILEAIAVAKSITGCEGDNVTGSIRIGTDIEFGNYFKSDVGIIGANGIEDTEIISTLMKIHEKKLKIPQIDEVFDIPITELGNVAERGVYYRDLYGRETTKGGLPRGPFDVEKIYDNETVYYPILWAHDAKRETKLIVKPDRKGIVRRGQESRANKLWDQYKGTLCFNNDFGLGSQPLAACMISTPSFSGLAWTGFKSHNEKFDAPIILWANSTIGIMTFWWKGSRQQGGRARLSIKNLPSLPILDVRKLSIQQLEKINKFFDEKFTNDLLPANEAYRDNFRQEIDKFLLMDILSLPEVVLESLKLLRLKWCSEPSVHGGKSTNPLVTQYQM